jgi:hypothetical protein
MSRNCEVREMRIAETELLITGDGVNALQRVTEERRDTEIGHASFGEGRLEKGQ